MDDLYANLCSNRGGIDKSSQTKLSCFIITLPIKNTLNGIDIVQRYRKFLVYFASLFSQTGKSTKTSETVGINLHSLDYLWKQHRETT